VTVSRPPSLRVGVEVLFDGSTQLVQHVSATQVGLQAPGGELQMLPLVTLLTADGFAVSSTGGRVPLPARAQLEDLPDQVRGRAEFWERHVLDVLVKRDDQPQAGSAATLRQRELTKIADLAASGHTVPLTTFQRMRRAYQSQGIIGLVDGRGLRKHEPASDERLIAAIAKAAAEQTQRSTGTVARLQRRVEQILSADGIDPVEVMPSRATFFRLVAQLTKGRHTFGSAPTRRSLAARPSGMFGSVQAMRPGELVQVDSTPLDVRVILDDGTVDRVELTWMVDVATRTVAAAVLRPTTKTVDAALLLARALTPEPMRPGWVHALKMSQSVLPFQRLVALDARIEHAAARPVIVPETIVCDHGMVYLSTSFKAACRAMGINFQPTHPGSPWEKGIVERSFGSLSTLFAQYVKGYVGRSVDRRGRDADADAVFSILQLQELLDEWIVASWQNRQHDGLRHPVTPGRPLSPNEQYAALVEVAGYVPVPLSADDYLELLPLKWRTINSYGIKIDHRRYDSAELNPHRGQHSGVAASKGRWEIHYDPYDVTRIWVRNHGADGWITVPWNHLASAPAPFGEQAWSAAQQVLRHRGDNPQVEADIAGAVNDLLRRAENGPTPVPGDAGTLKRGRRAAARTRATSTSAWPHPPTPAESLAAAADIDADLKVRHSSAQIIPLPIFDAHAESKKWW